jgi:hypothetical protein
MSEIVSFTVEDFIYPGEYSDGMYMYMLVASRISGRICKLGLTYEDDFSFHASGLRSDGERLFEYSFTKAEDAMLVRLQGIEN